MMTEVGEASKNMMKGNIDGLDKMFRLVMPAFTDHVIQQRKRVGGDFSIAWALFSREQREMAQKLLGDDVIFLVLNMTKECQTKRMDKRHEGGGLNIDVFKKMYDLYEPTG